MQRKIDTNALRLGTRLNWSSTWCECPKTFIETFLFDINSRLFLKVLFDQLRIGSDDIRLKKNSKKQLNSGKLLPFSRISGKWHSYIQNITESSELAREKNNNKQNQHASSLSPFFGCHVFDYAAHTEKISTDTTFNSKNKKFLPTVSGQLLGDYIANQISASPSLKDQSFKRGLERAIKRISNEFVKARVLRMVVGIKIVCSGKWKKTKSGRSQKVVVTTGRLHTQTVTALTSFGFATSVTKFGSCGIKVWVNYKPLRF